MNDFVDTQYEKFLTITSDDLELKMIEVIEKEQLDFLVQIGVRDVSVPIFEDFQLLLAPAWSCYIAYLHETSKYQIVKDIAISEGLFLSQPQS